MVARPSDRACSDCAGPITRHSKTGRCGPCSSRATLRATMNKPEVQARRLAGLKRAHQDPQCRAEKSARMREHCKRPEVIEKRRAAALRNYDKLLGSPQARAALSRPEVAAKRSASLSATMLADIPPEWRDEYREIAQRRRKKAAEARAIIAQRIAAAREAERARIAQMSPFERQMEALKRGAGLTSKLNLSRGYDFTLGGVSSI